MSEKIKSIIKGILWTAFIGICLYATFIGGPRDRKKNEIPKPPTEVYNEIPKPSTEVYIASNENVYHDGGCELIPADLSKSEIVTEEEAKTMGCIPCSICEPDRIIEMEMEFYNERIQHQKELEMEMELYNEIIQNQDDPPPQFPYY